MTEKDKTNYMRMALAMADIPVGVVHAEIIWRIYEGINKKKGGFSVKDATSIATQVCDKYAALKEKEEKTELKNIARTLEDIRKQINNK